LWTALEEAKVGPLELSDKEAALSDRHYDLQGARYLFAKLFSSSFMRFFCVK
jgi:hypothetical protein